MEYGREPPPRRPDADPGAPRDPDYVEDDRLATHEEIVDRLRSLRTALMLVALLSVIALGIGLWALLQDNGDERDRTGASPERVSQIEDRVDQLSEGLDDRASNESVEELQGRQQELADQVESLRENSGNEELAQSVEELSQSVQELEQRVEELEQQQEDEANAP